MATPSSDSGAGVAIQAASSPASASSSAAPVGAFVTPETGLLRGIPQQFDVHGRVFMGKAPVQKAEVLIAAYDLATATTGEPLGMALTDENGFFRIKYVLSPAEKFDFLKIEARGVKYVGDADGMEKGLSMLGSIVNGFPAGDGSALMVSPVTDALFARFRRLVAMGVEPHTALRQAALDISGNGGGSAFGLKTSPLLTPVTGDEQTAAYMSAWDEAIRFERIYPDSYFLGMSRDFEDGIFNAIDGDGKKVEVIIHDGVPKKYKIPQNYYTSLVAQAAERYAVCQNKSLDYFDQRRISAKCVTQVYSKKPASAASAD